MPALQVRDFPQDLYEELKAYSEAHHRSVAQQTIVAVDAMIHDADRFSDSDGLSAEAKMRKRGGILLRAKERAARRKKNIPLPQELIERAREERGNVNDIFAREHLGASS